MHRPGCSCSRAATLGGGNHFIEICIDTEECHFGEDLLVTRKGAIRAGVGEMGIIPGSMGSRS